ncbi:two-component system regulatory protein YycI [Evansella halocellulosilytica]|uniref:two-component system regulatory protein YycI n=1 Tax=Evansella halocellulosilytica TaxID=2011013 RepID=UPI000BB692C4|nr:two-component system regulatory protein YycI [Evansella halocellulosilytica]
MDFSKTKTIFIITFLILNIFLTFQLVEKRTSGNISSLSPTSLQLELNEWNIDVHIDDAEETQRGSYISGTTRSFSEERVQRQLDGQNVQLIDEYEIYSELEDPYQLSDDNLRARVDAFLQQNILYGDEYQFSHYDEERNIIALHQTYEGRPIDQYKRSRVHLVLTLNEDFQVVAYNQQYMEITPQGGEQEMLSPMEAIKTLLREQLIPENTVIDNVQLGYNSQIQTTVEIQVFSPVWQIQVNDEIYLVSAIESDVQRVESE